MRKSALINDISDYLLPEKQKIFYRSMIQAAIFRTCFTVILFLIYFFSAAQETRFRFDKITSENVKIEKGLSVNSVSCITQDNTGYMWFGTWDGLNKFDGYKFTVFKATEPGKDNDISNQTVNSLITDKSGNIWIATEGGLDKYESDKQKFVHYKHVAGQKNSLSNDTVLSVCEDSYGNLWAGTQNGLNLLNMQTGNFTAFFTDPSDKNSVSSNRVFDIAEDKLGCLWFATDKGLNRYNPLTRKFTRYLRNPENANSLISDTVICIFRNREGQIITGTVKGLCSFDTETGIFTRYSYNPKDANSLSGNIITDIFEDSKGVLWIGTNDAGLSIFDKKTGKFSRYSYVSNDLNSLSNNHVAAISEDKSGIIWVATSKGVNKIDRNSYKFLHYHHVENDATSLNNNLVWNFLEDKNGIIWIGTDDGINLFDRKTGRFTAIKHNPADKNSISGNVVKAVIIDKDGNAWVGTEDAGLDEFAVIGTGKYQKLKLIKNFNRKKNLCDNTVWCLHEDKEGYIWIGTNNGLNRYDKKKDGMLSFKYNPVNPYCISNNIINVIYEDKAGVMWFGTYNGLNKYDKKTGKFYSYKHNSGDATSLSNNRVFGIYEDKTGIMWIGTMGGGLNRFDRKTGAFKYYLEKDGLANNMVYCMTEDDAGNLWLTTNNGISRFNIKTGTFVNYDVKDGVQSSEFNQNAAFKTKDGEFFLGGMNGFNAFYPADIRQNKFIPPIVITGFKKINEVQETEIHDGDTIILSYKDNFFTLEFSALDYSNPSKNKYAYRLEHYDKEWILCDAGRRFAEYTKVSPGVYRFRVKGTNSDGVWNDKGISVVVIITPPWWDMLVFRIPAVVLLAFAGWYLITLRFRQLRKKHDMEKKVLEIEKQVFEIEQKALRLQMNPHFIFNSLNSIQSFIVNNDSDKATLYLAKFAQLMRLILSNSSEPFVPVKDEIKALTYYMDIENLRFDDKFNYKIIVDPKIDDEFTGIPPMVIQPYVENAILHGIIHKKEKGNISVSLTLSDDNISCVILDDGVGRDKAAELKEKSGFKHVSRGMVITKERLEILNKQTKGRIAVTVTDIKDKAGNAGGTKVEIIIPFRDV